MKKHLYLVPLALLSVSLSASMSHAQEESKPQKARLKPQSVLAAKGTFPVIKATDTAVKKAHLATDLAGAKKLVGRTVGISGTVVKTYLPKSNKLVLLNFAKDYKKALVVAVMAKDFGKFPALTSLEGKKVLVTGKIGLYKGTPEVEVSQPGAIKLVK